MSFHAFSAKLAPWVREGSAVLTFKNSLDDEYAIKVYEGSSYIYSGISGSGATKAMDAIEASTLDPPILHDLINVTAQASGSVDQYASGSVSAEMEIFVAST